MRLTKDEIEGRKQSIKICREYGHNGFFIPFPELEEMLDQLIQREQDVADMVAALSSLDMAANAIDNRDRPKHWRALSEASATANALLARIREQDGR